MSDLDKKTLEKLTKAELAEKVKSLKLKAGSKATKDDLISLILENHPKAEKAPKASAKAAKVEKPVKKAEPKKEEETVAKKEKELATVSSKNSPKESENQKNQDLVSIGPKKTEKKDDPYISEGYTGHKYSHFEQ